MASSFTLVLLSFLSFSSANEGTPNREAVSSAPTASHETKKNKFHWNNRDDEETSNHKVETLVKRRNFDTLNACLISYPESDRQLSEPNAKRLLEGKYFILEAIKNPSDHSKSELNFRQCYVPNWILKGDNVYLLKNFWIDRTVPYEKDVTCTPRPGHDITNNPLNNLKAEDEKDKAVEAPDDQKKYLRRFLGMARWGILYLPELVKKTVDQKVERDKFLTNAQYKLVKKHFCECKKLKLHDEEIEYSRDKIVSGQIRFKDEDKGVIRSLQTEDFECDEVIM